MRSSEGGEDRHCLFDTPIEFEVFAVGTGNDAESDDAGLPLLGDFHRVLVGGDGQANLVAGGLQRAGQMHNAVRLIVYLIYDEQDAHSLSQGALRWNTGSGRTGIIRKV
jgi:hypothetical protein